MMYYAVSTIPVATLSAPLLRVNDKGDGTSTLVRVSDGQVLSCQPSGAMELRPPGTDGGYETCVVANGTATYNPVGPAGAGYVFALKAVPNE